MLTLRYSILPVHLSERILHSIAWVFIITERWLNHYLVMDKPLFGVYQTIFLLATFIIPVYINAFVLIPKYLKKSEWIQYIAILISLLLCVNVVRGILAVLYFQLSGTEYNLATEFSRGAFIDYTSFDRFIFSPTSWILWLSFTYRFIKDWLLHERIQSTLKAEKMAMELAFLKSQVNPHFLFNTLNNLYALALEEKAQRTADGVAKMGTFMRYSLHDAQADYILLSKEIDYIEKYIELQQLRIVEGANVHIKTDIEVNGIKGEKIAPMMLLPFIENAFKYGISTVHPSSISIELKLLGSLLTLKAANTTHENIKEDQGGIGLKNVYNRLRLIYPNRHKLAYAKMNNIYNVTLEIDLSE